MVDVRPASASREGQPRPRGRAPERRRERRPGKALGIHSGESLGVALAEEDRPGRVRPEDEDAPRDRRPFLGSDAGSSARGSPQAQVRRARCRQRWFRLDGARRGRLVPRLLVAKGSKGKRDRAPGNLGAAPPDRCARNGISVADANPRGPAPRPNTLLSRGLARCSRALAERNMTSRTLALAAVLLAVASSKAHAQTRIPVSGVDPAKGFCDGTLDVSPRADGKLDVDLELRFRNDATLGVRGVRLGAAARAGPPTSRSRSTHDDPDAAETTGTITLDVDSDAGTGGRLLLDRPRRALLQRQPRAAARHRPARRRRARPERRALRLDRAGPLLRSRRLPREARRRRDPLRALPLGAGLRHRPRRRSSSTT